MDRLTHTLIGALILGGFFVMSVSAFYLLKRKHELFAKRCFTLGLVIASVFSVLALVSGHDQAQQVARTQPAKLAAFEGHFVTGPADLYLFGWPDAQQRVVRGGLALPGLLSYLVYNDAKQPVTGLDQFPQADQPPVWLPFQSYHLMIGLGMLMIALTLGTLPLLRGGRVFRMRWLLRIYVVAVLGPMIANQAGWVAAEVGRQPWVVYPSVQDGVAMPGLRTSDGLSESVSAGQVLWSIIMFGLIYLLLFGVWLFVLDHKIRHGPDEHAARPDEHGGWVQAATVLPGHAHSLTEAKPEGGR